ncbi:MAG: O-antigen ligase family protein, partial [Victivallaceae bacterium]
IFVLAAGMLFLSYLGLEQYFWGFQESRQYLLDQEAKGIPVSGVLKARALDDRVFATFTSCNSLAGYMLLLIPMLIAALWRWGGRVEPVKVSRVLFVALGGGAAIAVLLLTKSRAAYLAIALTIGLAAVLWPMRRRWKIALIALMAATVLAGALYIHRYGRGFESMEARADYLRSSALLLAEHPLAGCGWGEFFFEHMRIKKVPSDEAAHDPHNLVMTAAQAGLPLTLLVLAAMLYPLWILGCRARRLRRENGSWPPDEVAALIGLTAFYLHSMMEIHFQIPGIMAAYFTFSLAMLSREEPPAETPGLPRPATVGLWVLFLGLGVASILAGDWALKGEMAHDRLLSLASRSNKSPEQHDQVSPDAVRMTMREATRLRPDSPFPYSVAADFMLSRDNLDEAEFLLEEAQKRAPKRPSIYQRRALIALKRGDLAQAEAWMAKARALFPNNPDYQKPVTSGNTKE